MEIRSGRLTKKQMARFTGVEIKEVDNSLSRLVGLGYMRYKKISGGKYQFIFYPEPITIRELELTNQLRR